MCVVLFNIVHVTWNGAFWFNDSILPRHLMLFACPFDATCYFRFSILLIGFSLLALAKPFSNFSQLYYMNRFSVLATIFHQSKSTQPIFRFLSLFFFVSKSFYVRLSRRNSFKHLKFVYLEAISVGKITHTKIHRNNTTFVLYFKWYSCSSRQHSQ